MQIIAGLGNPGRRYAKTRHNVGFRVVELLAERMAVVFERTKFKGEYARATVPTQWEKQPGSGTGELLLVKPQTYMNLSGETVQWFVNYYKVGLSNLLVVVDDVALPLGTLRLRRGGSAGGHNGLKDIEQRLGSQDFSRLRVGVGGREAGVDQPTQDLKGHVLTRFSEDEERVLAEKLALASDACLFWAGHGVEEAMNRYNAGEKAEKKKKDPGRDKQEKTQQRQTDAPGPSAPGQPQ